MRRQTRTKKRRKRKKYFTTALSKFFAETSIKSGEKGEGISSLKGVPSEEREVVMREERER